MQDETLWRWRLKGYSPLQLVSVIEEYGKDSEMGRLADEVLAEKIAEVRAFVAGRKASGSATLIAETDSLH